MNKSQEASKRVAAAIAGLTNGEQLDVLAAVAVSINAAGATPLPVADRVPFVMMGVEFVTERMLSHTGRITAMLEAQ